MHNLLMSPALLNLALAGAVAVVLSPFVALAVAMARRRARSLRDYRRVAEFVQVRTTR